LRTAAWQVFEGVCAASALIEARTRRVAKTSFIKAPDKNFERKKSARKIRTLFYLVS
jgi:hypothetical protein